MRKQAEPLRQHGFGWQPEIGWMRNYR